MDAGYRKPVSYTHLDVYKRQVMDNWSDDGTYELLEDYAGRYPDKVKIDRFPASGKKDYFDLYHQMAWTEELAKTLNYEWFIHYDACLLYTSRCV